MERMSPLEGCHNKHLSPFVRIHLFINSAKCSFSAHTQNVQNSRPSQSSPPPSPATPQGRSVCTTQYLGAGLFPAINPLFQKCLTYQPVGRPKQEENINHRFRHNHYLCRLQAIKLNYFASCFLLFSPVFSCFLLFIFCLSPVYLLFIDQIEHHKLSASPGQPATWIWLRGETEEELLPPSSLLSAHRSWPSSHFVVTASSFESEVKVQPGSFVSVL